MITEAQRIAMLSPPKGRVRVVLDTDAYNEIDDQFAITQMLLSPERFDLRAIYAAPFHNSRSDGPRQGMERSYDEILRLLDRLGVAPQGLAHRGVLDYVGPSKVPQPAPAVDHLIDLASRSSTDDPLYVVAIAAISNVASALLAAPEIADRIVVVWLGGHALEWPDSREFNLRQDVGGAQVLLDCGVPVVLVPAKGVSSNLHSTVPEIERYVEPQGAIGQFLAQRFKDYSTVHRGWSKAIWDMAAVAWLLDPSWVESALVPTPILSAECNWSVDRRRHAIRYVSFVDRDAVLMDFFGKLEAFAARKA